MSKDGYQYRVTVRRRGCHLSHKVYETKASAMRRMGLVSSDEPWLYYNPPRDPDELNCCSGSYCGCGGQTVRQVSDQIRANMPDLLSAEVQRREVGEWEPIT